MKKFLKVAIMPMILLLLTSCNMKSKEALDYTEKTINISKDINNISNIRYLGQGIYAVNTSTDKNLSKYKLMDSSGNLISNKIFYHIEVDANFDEKQSIAVTIDENNTANRLINKNGDFVSEPYKFIIYLGDRIYKVSLNGKTGYINSEGKKLMNLSDIPFELVDDSKFLPYRNQSGKYGFMDDKGKNIVPCKFDNIEMITKSKDLVAVCKDKKWGAINKQGKLIIDFQFNQINSFFEGLACVYQNNKCGFIDSKGNIKIPCKFDEALNFSEGLVSVKLDNRTGVIDKDGNVVIPFKFDSISTFKDGLTSCRINKKMAVINTKGEYIIEPSSDINMCFPDKKNISVYSGSKIYLTDIKGKKLTSTMYDQIKSFIEDYAHILNNNKLGILDIQGKEIIPAEFDDISDFKNGFCIVSKQGEYGIMDTKGKYKIPLKYNEIKYICNDYYAVKKDSKWGMIDINDKVIKPFEYDNASVVELEKSSTAQLFLTKGTKGLVLDFKNY
ncbi:WG repeat-containing protein [Clostridium novyi]|uniref:WG repeat-containing protein n=1 Tax=Clostridium novyi TaxID=1542 RepID=UPI000AB4ECF4|nr:WG repeat-containing protein [Clostridium novyi]